MTRNMKVLVLSSMYPNSRLYLSGIFVHEQVKEFKKQGIDVTVIAPVPYSPPLISNLKSRWKKIASIPTMELIDGIKVIHTKYIAIPKGIFKAQWSYSYVNSIMNHLSEFPEIQDADIIHAHGALPNDYAAYLLSKKLKKPYILTVHGDAVYVVVKKSKRFKYSKLAIEQAAAVVGVSSKVKERVIEYSDREDNIFVIYNGFNRENTSEIKPQINDTKIDILFAANLIERKGCEYVVKAFNKLSTKYKNIRLTIAGGGILYFQIKNLIEELGITQSVRMTNALQHSEMLNEIASCDIFILPSWDEAFGVVYLEAMNFKKPIIGTKGEGISDVVIDGENGLLVRPRNIDDIIEKLTLLIDDENLRKKIGENGFKAVDEMSWKNNARKQIEIYNKILN